MINDNNNRREVGPLQASTVEPLQVSTPIERHEDGAGPVDKELGSAHLHPLLDRHIPSPRCDDRRRSDEPDDALRGCLKRPLDYGGPSSRAAAVCRVTNERLP